MAPMMQLRVTDEAATSFPIWSCLMVLVVAVVFIFAVLLCACGKKEDEPQKDVAPTKQEKPALEKSESASTTSRPPPPPSSKKGKSVFAKKGKGQDDESSVIVPAEPMSTRLPPPVPSADADEDLGLTSHHSLRNENTSYRKLGKKSPPKARPIKS